MATLTFDKARTGLLVIDPYNDFLSEGGKVWKRVGPIAQGNQCIPHMIHVLEAARRARVRVFFAPHHRYRPGDYETWINIAPIQQKARAAKTFEDGTWGGRFRTEFEPLPGEIVALEHWCSSGFANTDLDLQLKRHGVLQLIVIGLLANTCVEATVRFAAELGYDVTLVRDAVASLSEEEMHAALEINLPSYARAIVTTREVIEALGVTER